MNSVASTRRPDGPIAADLSIIIVTWNSRHLIARCLDRVFASRTSATLQVIVVDNASHDGTAEVVRESYPDVTLIESPDNLGFGAGNNLGFRHAEGRFVLLLNPDAFLDEDDALEGMIRFLDAHPDIAAIGPQLVNPDGSHQVGDGGFRPTLAAVAAHSLFLTKIWPSLAGLYINARAQLRRTMVEVDWICGACLMIRRDAFAAVGGFDESFFMYSEDVELGCRLRDAGYRLAYLPPIRVLHIQGGTQRGASAYHYSTGFLKGRAELFRRRNGPTRFFFFKLLYIAGFLIRGICYSAIGATKKNPLYREKARGMFRYIPFVARLEYR